MLFRSLCLIFATLLCRFVYSFGASTLLVLIMCSMFTLFPPHIRQVAEVFFWVSYNLCDYDLVLYGACEPFCFREQITIDLYYYRLMHYLRNFWIIYTFSRYKHQKKSAPLTNLMKFSECEAHV